jgi:hypothetical protein
VAAEMPENTAHNGCASRAGCEVLIFGKLKKCLIYWANYGMLTGQAQNTKIEKPLYFGAFYIVLLAEAAALKSPLASG